MSEVARYFTNLEIVTVLRPAELKCNHIKVCNRSTFLLSISPYSDRMRENTDQNNSEYGHFLRSYFYFVSFFIFSITYKKNCVKLGDVRIIVYIFITWIGPTKAGRETGAFPLSFQKLSPHPVILVRFC